MELRHLKYFITVAEELSFTKAAERLNMAQPPLSRQIHDLEAEIGTELFSREHRTLRLTEEGGLFLHYARQIISLADRAIEEVRGINSGITGTLYLASVEGRGPKLIADWITRFSQQFPKVSYNLWNGNSEDASNRVINGLCDLAIVIEPYNTENLSGFTVFQEPWVAILPASSELARHPGDTVNLVDLSSCDLIVPSRKNRVQEIRNWFALSGVAPNIRCEMAHVMNAYVLVEAGVGVAIFPASAVDLLASDSVVVKKIVNPTVMASYSIVWNSRRQLPPIAREFMQLIQSDFKDLNNVL